MEKMKLVTIILFLVSFHTIASASQESMGDGNSKTILLSQSLGKQYEDQKTQREQLKEEIRDRVSLFYCTSLLKTERESLINLVRRDCRSETKLKDPLIRSFCSRTFKLAIMTPSYWQEVFSTAKLLSLSPNSSGWKGIENKVGNSVVLAEGRLEFNLETYDYYRSEKGFGVVKYKCHPVEINFLYDHR